MAQNQHYNDSQQPTDTDPIVDMDDTTGSNGGPINDRFSGDTDDAEGDRSTSSTPPDQARSDTARVDGAGISGDTGDDDTAQSGGRSQY